MRKIGVLVVIVSIAASASAQRHVVEDIQRVERPHGAPRTIGELVERVRASQAGRVRANVISVDWTTDSFIIPVAGNAAGANNTYFRSDVSFNNDRLADQRITVGWLAQGVNSCAEPLQYFVLGSNSITLSDDFVAQKLGKTGIGAILVVSVTANGSYDDDGEIDGVSRIWTPQPGTGGTVSQNFAAIDVRDSLSSIPATLMGLKQNSQFRANVGVANLDNVAAHTWRFRSIATGVTTTISVPPCSMALTAAANGSASNSGNVAFTVTGDTGGYWWTGFGSSTDNVTGDGWVSRAIQ